MRVRSTTFGRLGGILDTLKAHLPEHAKAITKRTVTEYIETRAEEVKPGTVAKEMSVLKHCLRLAVEWGELNQNPAAGARLPQLPPGRTRYLTPGELKAALESARDWLLRRREACIPKPLMPHLANNTQPPGQPIRPSRGRIPTRFPACMTLPIAGLAHHKAAGFRRTRPAWQQWILPTRNRGTATRM